MEIQNKNIPLHKIFNLYSKDNRFVLSGVGVIATVTALFLNLDPQIYGDSLKELQVLLLLFLTFSLIFLAVATYTWILSHADSWFGGLVTFSIALLIIRLWFFILENFREELNGYLFLIQFSIIIIIFVFLLRIRDKIEKYLKMPNHPLQSLLYGFLTYTLFYLYSISSSTYQIFYRNEEFNLAIFKKNFYNPFFFQMALWLTVVDLYMNNPEIHKRRWLVILIFSPALFFIADLIIDLMLIFKY